MQNFGRRKVVVERLNQSLWGDLIGRYQFDTFQNTYPSGNRFRWTDRRWAVQAFFRYYPLILKYLFKKSISKEIRNVACNDDVHHIMQGIPES